MRLGDVRIGQASAHPRPLDLELGLAVIEIGAAAAVTAAGRLAVESEAPPPLIGMGWNASAFLQKGPMSGLGPGCVETCLSQGCAELFSQFPSLDRTGKRNGFSNRRNRDGISTRKFRVGVFT